MHTEDALLASAARLFAQHGVDHTSLADIGENAGYSRGLVNFHFGSRAVLLERLAQRVQNNFLDRLTVSDGDELAALSVVAGNYLAMLQESEESTRAYFIMGGAALPADSALRSVFVTGDRLFCERVQHLLMDGQHHKTINTDIDPAGMATAIIGMLRGIAMQYLLQLDDEFDVNGARDACEEFIQSGCAPRVDA